MALPNALDHADALRVADGLEAGVDVEFCEDVFDVIVYGGGADVELIGNSSGAVALRQTLQHFNFTRRQMRRRVVRTIPPLRSHKLT